MDTPVGLVYFDIPYRGRVVRTAYITTLEKARAFARAMRETNREKKILQRALSKLTKTQRNTIVKYLNINAVEEAVFEAIVSGINGESAS